MFFYIDPSGSLKLKLRRLKSEQEQSKFLKYFDEICHFYNSYVTNFHKETFETQKIWQNILEVYLLNEEVGICVAKIKELVDYNHNMEI